MRKNRIIWIKLIGAACLCQTLCGGDITLKALSSGTVKAITQPENAAISSVAISGPAFVIYCSDIQNTMLMQPSGGRAMLDKTFLSQISDITAQATDRLSVTSLVLTAYEQAAHLALRFARPTPSESSSLEKQVADIHEVLRRLFLAANDKRSGRPEGVAVDWMMLANHNPSSFDYSQWRF